MTRANASSAARSPRVLRAAALATTGMLVSTLVACEDHLRLSAPMALTLGDPTTAHPIGFAARTEILDVELPPMARGLSHNQSIDVYRFALRFKAESTGQMRISAPAGRGGPHDPALGDVRRAFYKAGIEPGHVAYGDMTMGERRAPHVVRIAYQRPVAVPPECGHWWRDVGRERERVPYPEYGCATQRNIALMVANSRDLMSPQDETPASSERRVRVWSKYVGGEGGSASSAEPSADTKKGATPQKK